MRHRREKSRGGGRDVDGLSLPREVPLKELRKQKTITP
jgi:hypothetical protein